MSLGTVINRKWDKNGNTIGHHNDNPILDSSVYEVEFPDGEVLEYLASIIAKNLYSQVDEESHHQVMLDKIVDHMSGETALQEDQAYIVQNSVRHMRKTTKGWKLCVQWKDTSTGWEPLADMKHSYPLETAEYAVTSNLDN